VLTHPAAESEPRTGKTPVFSLHFILSITTVLACIISVYCAYFGIQPKQSAESPTVLHIWGLVPVLSLLASHGVGSWQVRAALESLGSVQAGMALR